MVQQMLRLTLLRTANTHISFFQLAFPDMSAKYKLKYEVLAILRENILMGMSAFGLPIGTSPGDGGWVVMEADQPSMRNLDKAVLVWQEKVERLAYGTATEYNRETGKFDDYDHFVEQQHWKIKVLRRRSTKPVTDEEIPITTEDVAGMLIAWFNRHGCEEFRKHDMANLFVQMKDLRTYKDPSDVNQWATEFVLKLQVVKQFSMEVDAAKPQLLGALPIDNRVVDRLREILDKLERGEISYLTP